jgi:hypothetical protein
MESDLVMCAAFMLNAVSKRAGWNWTFFKLT